MKPWHIIVVIAVFLLFFGIPKLPELARSIGRSLRIFKAETTGLLSDDLKSKDEAEARAASERTTPERTPVEGETLAPDKGEKP
jgi:sec-independent protein translocase protein TatA